MIRKLSLLALIVFASIASARVRSVSHPAMGMLKTATVQGTVTSVTGNIISFAGGLVTIDASDARIVTRGDGDGSLADLHPGMIVVAVVDTPTTAGAPLHASVVAWMDLGDVSLSGNIDAADVANRTITLLGYTIHVTDQTSFGGMMNGGGMMDGNSTGGMNGGGMTGGGMNGGGMNGGGMNGGMPGGVAGGGSLSDVVAGQYAYVQANAEGGQLVATSVMVMSQFAMNMSAVRGTVKSIGTDSWVITPQQGADVTVTVNTQTRIVGSPKVGDTVEVFYNTNASSALVAIAIVKFDSGNFPNMPGMTQISGVVKSMGSAAWTITRESGGDVQVAIDARTRIEPGIVAGDRVEVTARQEQNGTYTALLIMKRRW